MLLRIFSLFSFLLIGVVLFGQEKERTTKSVRVLIVGGDSSHDFALWYKEVDSLTLSKDGLAKVNYTEEIESIPARLRETDVLFLCNNKPVESDSVRKAIFSFIESGKGLILGHATTCYNWRDWPEYNAILVGGGVSWHDPYRKFTTNIIKQHPVTQNVSSKFELYDELYHYVPDNLGDNIIVLATSTSPKTNKAYPSVFIVKHPNARIVGCTLGHDGVAHTSVQYETIIRNALKWVSKN